MACPDGNCDNLWDNLCSYIGRLCINIETVIGGLISNQNRLRRKIEYEIPEVGDYPDCARVYLDPDLCEFTDTPNENTIIVGSHSGSGFVEPEGSIVCSSSIGTLNGAAASACQPLDENLDPITDGSPAYAWTLEADTGGCVPILIPVGDPCTPPTLQTASFIGDVTHPAGAGGSSIFLPLTIAPNCENLLLEALVFPEGDMSGVSFMRAVIFRDGIRIGILENFGGYVDNLIGDHGMHLTSYVMTPLVGATTTNVYSIEIYAIGDPFLIRSHDFAVNCFDCP